MLASNNDSPPPLSSAQPDSPKQQPHQMERNVAAVVVSVGITGVLGLVYWGLAARYFSPDTMGRGAAVINATIALSSVANLSLGAVFERFVPVAGQLSRRLVYRSWAISTVLALALGCAYLAVAPTDRLFESSLAIWTFPLSVWVLASFGLLDPLTAGLQVARWGAYKNIVHAIAKIVALIAVAGTASALVFTSTWILPAAVLVVILGIIAHRRLTAHSKAAQGHLMPSRSQLAEFFGATLLQTLMMTMIPLVVPLIVIQQLGSEANAYFTVAWQLAAAFFLVMNLAIGSFVAEASAHPARMTQSAKRFAIFLGVVSVGGALALGLIGPPLLGVISPQYRLETEGLLHILAFALPLASIAVMFNALSRVLSRVRLAAAVQLIATAIVAIGGWFAVERYGVEGIGWAFLAAEVANALILAYPLTKILRRLPSGSATGSTGAASKVTH